MNLCLVYIHVQINFGPFASTSYLSSFTSNIYIYIDTILLFHFRAQQYQLYDTREFVDRQDMQLIFSPTPRQNFVPQKNCASSGLQKLTPAPEFFLQTTMHMKWFESIIICPFWIQKIFHFEFTYIQDLTTDHLVHRFDYLSNRQIGGPSKTSTPTTAHVHHRLNFCLSAHSIQK